MAFEEELLKTVKGREWSQTASQLYSRWTKHALECFTLKNAKPWERFDDQKKINELLIYPLALCLTGEKRCKQADGSISLEVLAENTGIKATNALISRGQICGRMFQYGELTYTCKECANDPTCVLCYDCFKNSEHVNHKYKMHPTEGNGYCDCGDAEAFLNDPVCKLHKASDEEKNMDKQLPKALHMKLHSLVLIAIKFCVDVLNAGLDDSQGQGNDHQQIPVCMNIKEVVDDEYQTILFNDETHTYEAVIRALSMSITCDEPQAKKLAAIVDREGRTIVCVGPKEHCINVRQSVERRTAKDTSRRTQKSGPLLVKVMRSSVVAAQQWAVQLLQWLTAQVKVFPPLGDILGNILLHDCSIDCRSTVFAHDAAKQLIPNIDYPTSSTSPQCGHKSPCVRLTLMDRKLWKGARIATHQMFMVSLMMDMKHKQNFGRLIVEHYGDIYNDFVDDDHEHKFSITALTVQVFTIPTVARYLVKEANAMELIINYISEFIQQYVVKSTTRGLYALEFSTRPNPTVLERALYCMHDVNYLLTTVPKPEDWDDNLREAFLLGVTQFMRLIRDFQHMDEVKRQFNEHQTQDSEWETAFISWIKIDSPLHDVIQWSISDPIVHMNALTRCIQEITYQAEHMNEFQTKRRVVTVNSHEALSVEYDVAKEPVSIWQPLWRFCAALFTASPKIMQNYVCVDNESDPNFNLPKITDNVSNQKWKPHETVEKRSLKGFRTVLLEMPLRCIVLRAQFNAQLWRRNGFSFANQVHSYLSPHYRNEMFDRDVLMLQVNAAITDPNKFLIRLLDRFSLVKFATFGFENLPSAQKTESTPSTPSASHEDLSKITVVLAEEMFQILIYIVMERFQPGVGKVTWFDALKRTLIHCLCTGSAPYSQLERYIQGDEIFRKLCADEAVKEIADFKRPGHSQGVFVLKPSVRDQYNAFFWHYSRVNISQAEQQQKKDRANETKAVKACPPPICPEFEPFYQPIRRILECSLFSELLIVTFERYAKQSRFSSDGLMHRALYLCGIALNEQAADDAMRKSQNHRNPDAVREERFGFIENAEKMGLFATLQKCQTRAEKDGYADLLWWVKLKYEESVKVLKGQEEDAKSHEKQAPDEVDGEEKAANRARIARQKREQALERMRKLQTNFKRQNQYFFEETAEKKSKTDQPSSSNNEDELMEIDGTQSLDIEEEPEVGLLSPDAGFPVALGPNRLKAVQKAHRRVTCILCQESEVLSFDNGIVCAAFVESTRLFAQTSVANDNNRLEDYHYYAPSDLYFGQNLSTCAHTMHFSCYTALMQVNKNNDRQRNRAQAMSPRILDVDHNEYNCPLCKRLCNCAVPLLPTINSLKGVVRFSENRKNHQEDFPDWVQRMQELCLQQPTDDLAILKRHSRKRSHSERSLAEFKKDQAKEAASSPFGSEFPLNSLPAPLSALTENTRSSDALSNILHETLEAIKGFLNKDNKKAKDQSCSALKTLSPFFAALREGHTKLLVGMPRLTNLVPDDIENILSIYTTTGYILRTICAIMKLESKPLFGALNTRQMDTINAMVRLCAVVAFSAKPIALRLTMSRLLSPFVVPVSATLPIPWSVYTAKALNNVSEIKRHLLARKPEMKSSFNFTTTTSSMPLPSLLDHLIRSPPGTEAPSNTSTAPASPGPSNSGSRQQLRELPVKSEAFVDSNILNVDMVSMAIQLAMLSGWSVIKGGKQFLHNLATLDEGPIRVPDGSLDEHHAVHLCLLGHLFQAITCFTNEKNLPKSPSSVLNDGVRAINIADSPTPTEDPDVEMEASEAQLQVEARLLELLTIIDPTKASEVNLTQLRENVKACAVEFMKPLAVFYSALTLVPPPDVLKYTSIDEFEPLCRYLDLPVGLYALLKGDYIDKLFELWSAYIPMPVALIAVSRPLAPRTLIELPHDYTDLVNQAAKFRCPSVKGDGMTCSQVTMCLVCGEFLCAQSYCCQKSFNGENVGSCTYHVYYCGGNSGIFFRVRECQLMYLTATKRGCIKAAPYVDEFGETDWGFKRGNPLYLSDELYKKLQRTWLHQEVAEEVINQYEINIRNLALNWEHF